MVCLQHRLKLGQLRPVKRKPPQCQPKLRGMYRQSCGSESGIRCLFNPWIRDPEWVKKSGSGSGMNNPDHISKSLKNIFFLVKILKFFDVHPGSGMEKFGSGINIPDPQHCVSVPYTGYQRLFPTSLFPTRLHKTTGSRFFPLKILCGLNPGCFI